MTCLRTLPACCPFEPLLHTLLKYSLIPHLGNPLQERKLLCPKVHGAMPPKHVQSCPNTASLHVFVTATTTGSSLGPLGAARNRMFPGCSHNHQITNSMHATYLSKGSWWLEATSRMPIRKTRRVCGRQVINYTRATASKLCRTTKRQRLCLHAFTTPAYWGILICVLHISLPPPGVATSRSERTGTGALRFRGLWGASWHKDQAERA